MTLNDVLTELKKLGTPRNKKVYIQRGVKRETFGVSFANLNKLKKKIKTNQELAVRLWQTNIFDAMLLATMIADPTTINPKLLKKWAKDLGNYILADSFSKLVIKTNNSKEFMEKWINSSNEWIARTGWSIMAMLAKENKELNNEYFDGYLNLVEKKIHLCKNRTKDAMNNALIAIGIRNKGLKRKAISAAKRIGKVEVDHGDTCCKTPEAIPYIEKAWERKGDI